MTLALAGFATEVRPGIRVLVGQQSEINSSLKVAEVAETVSVQADVPIVETTKSAIGANITTRQIDELPLPERNFDEPRVPGSRNHAERDGDDQHLGGGEQRKREHVC